MGQPGSGWVQKDSDLQGLQWHQEREMRSPRSSRSSSPAPRCHAKGHFITPSHATAHLPGKSKDPMLL